MIVGCCVLRSLSAAAVLAPQVRRDIAVRKQVRPLATALQDWHRRLRQHWQSLYCSELTATPTESRNRFEVQVHLD